VARTEQSCADICLTAGRSLVSQLYRTLCLAVDRAEVLA
jgi:hypothetical protein